MALVGPQMSERKRVKVYELRENDWFDRGTGFCEVQTIHADGRIHVESEDEPERALLDVKIKKDDNYQRQQDTLIVWTDPEGVDMALSFQEADGCGVVWDTISKVQQRIANDGDGPSRQLMLPPPELKHLPDVEAMVRGAGASQQGRDALSRMILGDNYIAKLTSLVEMAEDLEDLPDLHKLCNIMKSLILFNDHAIIEHIVTDDIIYGVVGALEYDPDFPHHKANHRQYLAEHSRFKEVVRIQDETIRRKIHCTYRLQYLKDVVLARILDDPTFSVLNSLIYFHQIDIVQHITQNTSFITEVFNVITDPQQPQQKKKEAVCFVQQCCATAKPFNGPTRAQLYSTLVTHGLFPTVSYALQHHDSAVRVAGTEILVAIIDHDVTLIRTYIYRALTEKAKPLTDTLIELLLVEPDLGVKAQVADAIKVLLEPVNPPPADRQTTGEPGFAAKLRDQANASHQNDAFLQTFFDQSAKKLFQPLKDLERRTAMTGLTIHEISLYSHLVEILCFFVRQHSYRSKIFILQEGIAARTAQLLSCPEKHMKLSAIKYFRAVLNLNDEHHIRQMIQHHLFVPILKVLLDAMPRDNLLNSACLDLFEYIRRENIKALVYHLVENYREKILQIGSVDTFQGIILRYDQFMNPALAQASATGDVNSSMMTSDAGSPNTRHVTVNGGSRWQGLKDVDPDEDAYFNGSDGDDDDEDELSREAPLIRMNGASPLTKPLVDYPDDDDELDDDLPTLMIPFNEDMDISILDRIDKKPHMHVELASSPPSVASPSPAATPPRQAAPPPATPPSTSLSEKRRREEDDEDELGKLASNTAKRRNSSSSAASHISIKLRQSISPERQQTSKAKEDGKSKPTASPATLPQLDTSGDTIMEGQSLLPSIDARKTTPTRSPSLKRKKSLIFTKDGVIRSPASSAAGAPESLTTENLNKTASKVAKSASPTDKAGAKKITISLASKKEKEKPSTTDGG